MIHSKNDCNKQIPTSNSSCDQAACEPINDPNLDGSDIFQKPDLESADKINSENGINVTKVIKDIKDLNDMIAKAKSSEELVEILQEISHISQDLSHIPAIQYYLSIAAVTYLEHREKYSIINKRIQENIQKLRIKNMYNNNNACNDVTPEPDEQNITTSPAITKQGIVQIQKQIVQAKNENIINDILETNLFEILNNAKIVNEEEIKSHNNKDS